MQTSPTANAAEAGLAVRIPWILRVGVAGCFIGHGAFGVITKAAWVPYFGVVGISDPWAWKLMPWVGTMDILIGILALVRPCRGLLMWAVTWAIWTALLRPFSGEPFWEALERAGNYGVPLALLMIAGSESTLFSRLTFSWATFTPAALSRLTWTLRLTTFTLLCGHAGLGFFAHKAGLTKHYAALGVTNAAAVTPLVGIAEFVFAAAVLIFPHPILLVVVCVWKLASESLFVVAGSPVWEVIERAGSYTAPLALALLILHFKKSTPPRDSLPQKHPQISHA